MRFIDHERAQTAPLSRDPEGCAQPLARGFRRCKAEPQSPFRDFLRDDRILSILAALESKRGLKPADLNRFLLMIDAQRDCRNNDKRDAVGFRLCAHKADALNKLEDGALALARRERDDKGAPRWGAKCSAHSRALAWASVPCPVNRLETWVAGRARP